MSAVTTTEPNLLKALAEEEYLQCMRCGFCLAACPTYRLTGHEYNSPRGRIALVRAASENHLSLNDIMGPLDQCVGCRACEPACPAGVHYGAILETARAVTEQERPRSAWERLVRKVGMAWVLGTPTGIKLASWGLWFYQATGLATLARKTGLVKALAGQATAELEAVLPRVPSPLERRRGGGEGDTFPAKGEKLLRVGFFTGCLMEITFYQENRDSIALLQAAGCEVLIVEGQGCCGAVHSHAGEEELAHQQAKRNIMAYEAQNLDYVVNAAGGCGAALKEYKKWMANDPEWAARAEQFSAKVRDLSELLVELRPLTLGPREGRLTFQDSCHARNVQKVINQPRKLLKQIPVAEYVELPGSDTCCGAGGIYNVTQPGMAARMGNEKTEKVKGTKARTLVVANPPCHLQMKASLRRAGLDQEGVEVVHIASVLKQSLDAAEKK